MICINLSLYDILLLWLRGTLIWSCHIWSSKSAARLNFGKIQFQRKKSGRGDVNDVYYIYISYIYICNVCILQAGGTYTKDGSPQSFGLQTVGPLHSLWSVGPTWKVPGEVGRSFLWSLAHFLIGRFHLALHSWSWSARVLSGLGRTWPCETSWKWLTTWSIFEEEFRMEELKLEWKRKGGSPSEWEDLLGEGLKLSDVGWHEAARDGDPMKRGHDLLCEGRLLEYQCYDVRHRPQGTAVIEVIDWLDQEQKLIKAIHLAASDEYYQWYGEEKLKVDEVAYHFCGTGHRTCPVKLGRADGRVLIHLDRWRAVNAGLLEGQGYSHDVAVARMRSAIARATPKPVDPPGATAPRHAPGLGVGEVGSGLDAALAGGGFPPYVDKGPDEDRVKEKSKEPKASVGRMLADRADSYETSQSSSSRRKKRKAGRDEDRADRKKRSRGDPGCETSSEGEDSSGSGDMPFRKPSARVELDLWRQSQKNPGKLLKSGLQEMGRFLADRVGANPHEGWEDRRVMAYINQVLLTQHPAQSLGVRNLREAQTLGMALDLLMTGNLGSLGDLLMQRLRRRSTSRIGHQRGTKNWSPHSPPVWQIQAKKKLQREQNWGPWSWGTRWRRPKGPPNRDTAAGYRTWGAPRRHHHPRRVRQVSQRRKWPSTTRRRSSQGTEAQKAEDTAKNKP